MHEEVEDHKAILKPGVNCMGIYGAQSTGLLVDTCDYYREFYHAACMSRRYILLAGWQFDTEVDLLRGKEAENAPFDVRLLHFLEALCEATPTLHVYLLAWDFSVFFSMEREWFQDFIFNWSSHERIHFRFDSSHPLNATHHQKLVIIDGRIAFTGGIDICSDRWDDRQHLQVNPDRKNIDGQYYGAYHDIQSYHTGPVVKELVRLFEQRWVDSGADPLLLETTDGDGVVIGPQALPLPTGTVAISRTHARYLQTRQEPVQEIRRLFMDAILAAENLIYMENQYFSSQAVYWALVGRMSAPRRSRLQIVMILPDRLPFTDELVLGLPQMKMVRALQQAAADTGHDLGIYSTVCCENGDRRMTFIHSKLLLVDDRFLTVGSANATNRSMGLDTELNVSWEAASMGEGDLAEAIRGVRVSLLAEHAGMHEREMERFGRIEGLVEYLDSLVDDPRSRLCRYLPDPSLENSIWSEALIPVCRIVDPELPVVEEFLYENFTNGETNIFARGIMTLSQWFTGLF